MTLQSYLNNNFNTFLLILMVLMALYLFSCGSVPLKELPDDNFMEEYMKEAEAKFKEEAEQDSIKANDNNL